AGRQPGRIVGAFLGQVRVVRAEPGQFGGEELVRATVPVAAQRGRVTTGGPQLQQPPSSFGGQLGGQAVVIGTHLSSTISGGTAWNSLCAAARPRCNRASTASADRSSSSGTSFCSAAEKSCSTKSAASIRPCGRPMPTRTRK